MKMETEASAGKWEISIFIEKDDSWCVWGSYKYIDFKFSIAKKQVIEDIVCFFDKTLNNPVYRDKKMSTGLYRRIEAADITIGYFDKEIPVILVKDSEFDDRYFVYVSSDLGQFRFKILDIDDLLIVLRNLQNNLAI